MDPEAATNEYPAYVMISDELVNDLADLMESTDSKLLAAALSDEQTENLRQLIASIDEAAAKEGASFWTIDALRHANSWTQIRADASRIADSLEKAGRP